jgi:hypothetical protein
MWMLRRTLLLGVAALCAACAQPPAIGGEPWPELEDAALSELSGLARSPSGRQFFWGHNDSGHDERLFRIGPRGEALGQVWVKGARNIDWEDISDFHEDGKGYLLIGDIGDNRARRRFVRLYAVAEPAIDAERVALAWQIDYVYPDGPRDAEGLAVDPTDGEIYVLTKRDTPPALYRIPRPTGRERVTAEHVVDLETLPPPPLRYLFSNPVYGLLFNLPTALDIIAGPDGSARMLVVTYGDAHIYDRSADESWADALRRTPQTVPLPRLRQIEAGIFIDDGAKLLIGTEQRPAPLARVKAPEAP